MHSRKRNKGIQGITSSLFNILNIFIFLMTEAMKYIHDIYIYE